MKYKKFRFHYFPLWTNFLWTNFLRTNEKLLRSIFLFYLNLLYKMYSLTIEEKHRDNRGWQGKLSSCFLKPSSSTKRTLNCQDWYKVTNYAPNAYIRQITSFNRTNDQPQETVSFKPSYFLTISQQQLFIVVPPKKSIIHSRVVTGITRRSLIAETTMDRPLHSTQSVVHNLRMLSIGH